MILLNPGPVTLTERVRRSLVQPDLCHRESEFFALQDEARQRLLASYGLDPDVWAAVLMTGSGTAAVESMTAALIPANGRLLNLENGVYGDRIAQILNLALRIGERRPRGEGPGRLDRQSWQIGPKRRSWLSRFGCPDRCRSRHPGRNRLREWVASRKPSPAMCQKHTAARTRERRPT